RPPSRGRQSRRNPSAGQTPPLSSDSLLVGVQELLPRGARETRRESLRQSRRRTKECPARAQIHPLIPRPQGKCDRFLDRGYLTGLTPPGARRRREGGGSRRTRRRRGEARDAIPPRGDRRRFPARRLGHAPESPRRTSAPSRASPPRPPAASGGR